MKKLVQKSHYDYSTKHEAFPYQHEAFLEIKDKDYAAIFHEQGLGKTKIAIDLLLYWLKEREIENIIIDIGFGLHDVEFCPNNGVGIPGQA